MTKRSCTKCDKEKNLSEFRKDKTQKSGYRSECKVCSRAYFKSKYTTQYYEKYAVRQSNRRKENRKRIDAIKHQIGHCAFCTENFLPCLAFHHLDPKEKDLEISQINFSWERIEVEIQKCILVCNNCHTKIHCGVLDCNELPTGFEPA